MPENEEDLSPEELRREQEDYKRRLRESKYIQAQGGTSKVQHFQEGDQTVTDQQMIDRLGYDPGNPHNDLTRGFGSGVPTQRGIGYGANIVGQCCFFRALEWSLDRVRVGLRG